MEERIKGEIMRKESIGITRGGAEYWGKGASAVKGRSAGKAEMGIEVT